MNNLVSFHHATMQHAKLCKTFMIVQGDQGASYDAKLVSSLLIVSKVAPFVSDTYLLILDYQLVHSVAVENIE